MLLLLLAHVAVATVLTHEEVKAKLNNVPTFSILTAERKMISLGGKDVSPWDKCYSFWTDAVEVLELLQQTKDANPESGLHLGCMPLGDAFEHCGGFEHCAGEPTPAEAAVYCLQGPSAVVDAFKPSMLEQLRDEQITPGLWLLPIFWSMDFETPDGMIPLFLSEADFRAGWQRTGRSLDEAPASLSSMDVRSVIQRMLTGTDGVSWDRVRFVSSAEAYQLVQRLSQQQQEMEDADDEEEEDREETTGYMNGDEAQKASDFQGEDELN